MPKRAHPHPPHSSAMFSAFVSGPALALPKTSAPPAVCGFAGAPLAVGVAVAPAVTMRCRRDLKKEKSLRNLEFARSHRKKVFKRYNRRAVQDAVTDEDNQYLSSIYGTMRFGGGDGDGDGDRDGGRGGGRDGGRGGGRGGGRDRRD